MTSEPTAEAFEEALAAGQCSKAIDLVQGGLDPSHRYSEGLTPLHLAVTAGCVGAVTELVRRGADVNQHGGSNRMTPLHAASMFGLSEIAEMLIAAGADVSSRDSVRATPLHQAASWGYPDLVRLLLANGAEPGDRNAHNATPLQVAAGAASQASFMDDMLAEEFGTLDVDRAHRDHAAVAKLLIDKGVASADLKKAQGIARQYSDRQMQSTLESAPQGGGCYIATAVYGSYDSPEVLILRKYRDESLAQSLLGRCATRLYYYVSPRAALHFTAGTKLNTVARHVLDSIVNRLDSKP